MVRKRGTRGRKTWYFGRSQNAHRRESARGQTARQQEELARAVRILMEEFEAAISLGNQPWKRGGRILKILLFGSYARNDWVDDPENGYQSDFDLLIIVSHEKLTDIADYWYIAEDRILRDEPPTAMSPMFDAGDCPDLGRSGTAASRARSA